jgi:membrane protease YdiL (CAAX protease family)
VSRNRSEPVRDLSLRPALGLLVTLLGVGAMVESSVLLGPRLSLRPLIMIASMLLAAPAILALVLTGRPVPRALGLRAIDRQTALVAATLGLSLWVAALGLLELQSVVWPPPPGYLEAFRKIHDALRPANAFDAVLSVLAIAAAPAIFEETLVRGVVLPSLRPWLGGLGAVLVSALVFAVMHLDLYRFVFTFAVGAILGVVRLRAEALGPCMLVHGTLNTLTFLAAPLVDDPSGPNPDPRPALGAALLLGGLLVTLFLLRILRPPSGAGHDSLTPPRQRP